MRASLLLAPVLVASCSLLACGKETCEPAGLVEGDVVATIDGDAWDGAGASWSAAGDGVQFTTSEGDGWRLTLVANEDEEGQGVAAALVDGESLVVPLGDSSFAALYPTGVAGSYATQAEGDGQATLTRTGDAVAACFSFTASAADGAAVELTGGELLAGCVGCD